MLHAGQIIRYGPTLYRVEYVNFCRARIVPLSKRHVTLPDGREFDADRGGVNISPTSDVEIITDIERARTMIELEEAEAELAAAKAEMVRRDAPEAPAPAAPAPKRPQAHRRVPVTPGGGWYQLPVVAPVFKDGTLAATVWAYIGAHPGQATAAIVDGVKSDGAVAACVSRFHQAGLIEKRIAPSKQPVTGKSA